MKTNIQNIIWRITWGLGYYEDYLVKADAEERKQEFLNNPPAWARLPQDTPRVFKVENKKIFTNT